MSERYELSEVNGIKRVTCVHLQCDMCGTVARSNSNGVIAGFPYKNNSGELVDARGCVGIWWTIDGGTTEPDDVELCGNCAEWLRSQIRSGIIKR